MKGGVFEMHEKKKTKEKVKGIYFLLQRNIASDESANKRAPRVCEMNLVESVGEGSSNTCLPRTLGIDVTVDLRGS